MEKSPRLEPRRSAAGLQELLTALLLLLMPAAVLSAEGLSPLDARLSDLYVERGMLSYEQGLYQEARELAEKAVEFAPEASDALLLHARVLEKSFGLTARALAQVERALASGLWSRASALEARRLQALLLLKTRRYDQALAAVREAGAAAEAEPELLSAKARALHSLGRRAEADTVLRAAIERFPNLPDARAWRIHYTGSASIEDGRWVRDYLRNGGADGSLALKYVEMNAGGPGNRELLEALWKNGNAAPRSFALAVLNGVDAAANLERFLSAGGAGDYGDLRALMLQAPEAQRAKLREALRGLELEAGFDADGDGFKDRTVRMEKGEPRRVSFDQDQDGEAERELVFELRRPLRWLQRRSDGLVTLSYGDYPAAASVSMRTADGMEYLHRLVPDAFEFPLSSAELPPAAGDGIWLPGFAQMPLEEVDFSALRGKVYLVEEYKDGVLRRTRRMEKGGTFLTEENLIDAREVSRRVWYGGGLPVKGERDLDGNGYFETSEVYKNGMLASIGFDSNGNGNPEFSETFLEPLRRAWDVNDDGIIDIEEYKLGRGRVQRAFSVDLDGIFNEIRLDDRAYWDLMENKAIK